MGGQRATDALGCAARASVPGHGINLWHWPNLADGHPLWLLAREGLPLPAIPFMAAHKQLGVVNPLAQGHWRTWHVLRGSAPTLGSNDHTAEPNAMWPSMGSQVVNDNATHNNNLSLLWPCNKHIPVSTALSNAQLHCGSSDGKCHTMPTGQCPAQACKTKHMFKEIGVKGQPANANGQCPMRKARRNKLFSFFSQTMSAVMIPHHVQAQWPPAMPSYMPMPKHRLMGYH